MDDFAGEGRKRSRRRRTREKLRIWRRDERMREERVIETYDFSVGRSCELGEGEQVELGRLGQTLVHRVFGTVRRRSEVEGVGIEDALLAYFIVAEDKVGQDLGELGSHFWRYDWVHRDRRST